MRTGLDEETRAAVEEVMGQGSGQEVPGLPGLERFRNATVDGPTLADLAADVRAAGYQASVAHIAPLRGVVKAKGGAGVTAVVTGFRHEEGSGGVHVAVIDTGVCATPRTDGFLAGATDLEGKEAIDPLDVFPLADPAVPGDVDGNDRLDYAAGHGTFVVGVVQQVAPDARVSAYRAIDSDGVGSEVDVAVAMLRAVAAGAQVINLSLGVQTLDDQPLLAVEVALEQIDPAVVVVVAAAGNDGDERPCFPAAQSRGPGRRRAVVARPAQRAPAAGPVEQPRLLGRLLGGGRGRRVDLRAGQGGALHRRRGGGVPGREPLGHLERHLVRRAAGRGRGGADHGGAADRRPHRAQDAARRRRARARRRQGAADHGRHALLTPPAQVRR